MSADEPRRLKSAEETSPELARALEALGRRDVGSPRMARLAEKLAPLLDAEPAASPVSGGLRKLLLNKVLLACFIVGLAALGFWVLRTPERQPPSAAITASHVPEAEPEPEPEIVGTAPPSNATSAAKPSTPIPRPATARRVVPTASAQPSTASPIAAPARSSTVPDSAQSNERVATPTQPEAPRLRQRTETELLLDARKALPDDPSTALALLSETARRFPHGMLVPEREVLTIETLRKLGRATEASQRLRRFESQYPESIHLRRLQDR